MEISFVEAKITATVAEEIAGLKIQQWYETYQGLKVSLPQYNPAIGIEGKRLYDLKDMFGKTWEVKSDRLWWITGNIFVEDSPGRGLDSSEANYYLLIAGFAYILTKERLSSLVRQDSEFPLVAAGDHNRARGYLVPLNRISQVSDMV